MWLLSFVRSRNNYMDLTCYYDVGSCRSSWSVSVSRETDLPNNTFYRTRRSGYGNHLPCHFDGSFLVYDYIWYYNHPGTRPR